MSSSMMSRTTISMTTTSLQASNHTSNNLSRNNGTDPMAVSGGSTNNKLLADEMIEMLKKLGRS